MRPHPDQSARLRREIAAALHAYLREASSLPAEPASHDDSATGWFATAPHRDGPVYGREPWVHMRNVAVESVGPTVVVTFDWNHESGDSTSYLVAMYAPNWDVVTGTDALITKLDLLLDGNSWRDRARPIGGDLYLVVPPDSSSHPRA
ncbi:hypothetical protein DW322_07220 [Rhodococcus rhodnii]|nr:hypothetical protein DW322_07220 [Rhodococcus rhodnii]